MPRHPSLKRKVGYADEEVSATRTKLSEMEIDSMPKDTAKKDEDIEGEEYVDAHAEGGDY